MIFQHITLYYLIIQVEKGSNRCIITRIHIIEAIPSNLNNLSVVNGIAIVDHDVIVSNTSRLVFVSDHVTFTFVLELFIVGTTWSESTCVCKCLNCPSTIRVNI